MKDMFSNFFSNNYFSRLLNADWAELLKHADECEELGELMVNISVDENGKTVTVNCDDLKTIDRTLDLIDKLYDLYEPITGNVGLDTMKKALMNKRYELVSKVYTWDSLGLTQEQYEKINKLVAEYCTDKNKGHLTCDFIDFAAWLLKK